MAMIWRLDERRANYVQPGALVYSAKMDQEKLKCLACCPLGGQVPNSSQLTRICCCVPPAITAMCACDDYASRTFLDVFDNRVEVGVADPCFCCNTSHVQSADYRSVWFQGLPVQGKCCQPAPCPCVHCFGCCGEVLVLRSQSCHCDCCCCCSLGKVPGHATTCNRFCCWLICPCSLIFGLAPGEADKVAMLIRAQRDSFLDRGGEVVFAPPAPSSMSYGMQVAVPMQVGVPM